MGRCFHFQLDREYKCWIAHKEAIRKTEKSQIEEKKRRL